MTSDAASIAWQLHRSAPPRARRSVDWPELATRDVPPDYPERIPTQRLVSLLERLDREGSSVCAAGRDAAHHPSTSLSLLLRSSATVGDLIDRAIRFFRVMSSSFVLERRSSGDLVELVLASGQRDRTRGGALFSHYVVGGLVASLEAYTEGRARALEVKLPGPPGPDDQRLAEQLGAKVTFGSDLARVVLTSEALDTPLTTSDPFVASYLDAELERCVHRLKQAVTWQLDELIRERFADDLDPREGCSGTGRGNGDGGSSTKNGEPRAGEAPPLRYEPRRAHVGMREAAKQLGLSERTLRRRLEDEGTSFRERLDAVRRARALEMLPRDDVHDVAAHLGFVDARSFQRAFRRWTRITPGEYKRRVVNGSTVS